MIATGDKAPVVLLAEGMSRVLWAGVLVALGMIVAVLEGALILGVGLPLLSVVVLRLGGALFLILGGVAWYLGTSERMMLWACRLALFLLSGAVLVEGFFVGEWMSRSLFVGALLVGAVLVFARMGAFLGFVVVLVGGWAVLGGVSGVGVEQMGVGLLPLVGEGILLTLVVYLLRGQQEHAVGMREFLGEVVGGLEGALFAYDGKKGKCIALNETAVHIKQEERVDCGNIIAKMVATTQEGTYSVKQPIVLGNRWLVVKVQKLNEETWGVSHLVHMLDVTELKVLEQLHREDVAVLTSIFRSIPAGVALVDRYTGNIARANQQFYRMVRWERATLQNISQLGLKVDELLQMPQGGLSWLVLGSGGTRPFEVNVSLVEGTAEVLVMIGEVSTDERKQALKSLLFEMEEVSEKSSSVEEFLNWCYDSLSKVMRIPSVFVARWLPHSHTVEFIYSMGNPTDVPLPHRRTNGKGLTELVIKLGKTLVFTKDDIVRLASQAVIELYGKLCEKWVGIPIFYDGRVIGAIVIQDYHNPEGITPEEVELYEMVARQLGRFIAKMEMSSQLNGIA